MTRIPAVSALGVVLLQVALVLFGLHYYEPPDAKKKLRHPQAESVGWIAGP